MGLPGASVKVTYLNNNTVLPLITDADGNFSGKMVLGKGVNHEIEIYIRKAVFYAFTDTVHMASTNDTKDITRNVPIFEVFTLTNDPIDPKYNYLRDGLAWTKYTNHAHGKL